MTTNLILCIAGLAIITLWRNYRLHRLTGDITPFPVIEYPLELTND